MDAQRFDTLSRLLALSGSRRGLLSRAGLLVAAGLGLSRSSGRSIFAQSDSLTAPECALQLLATIRVTPEEGALADEDAESLSGTIVFSLSEEGNLEVARLELDTGAEHEVIGQAEGHSFVARVDLLPGRTLILVGVSLFPIEECRGTIDGFLTGPELGALGDWHAAMLHPDELPTDDEPGSVVQPLQTQTSESEPAAPPPTVQSGQSSSTTCALTCSGNRVLDPASCTCLCRSGFSDCDGACVDTRSDPAHCGACGTRCSPGATCANGACQCQPVDCGPGAIVDPQSCECVCPPDWTDCGQECCDPGRKCTGEVCCLAEGTPCTTFELCCSETCDSLVGGGTCAPCKGRSCSQDSDCCDGLSCTGGYCGGCRDRATACTDSSQCCYSECVNGACLSDTGGRCARNVDCRTCYLDQNCRRACQLGICGGIQLPTLERTPVVKGD